MKKYWDSLKKAFTGFMNDNAFKLSASLSYYTIFSIGPVLLIIISLAGVFFGREAVQGRIYGQIKGLIGPEAAAQVQEIIQNIQHRDGGTIGTIVGIGLLIIGSTGVFIEMQDSLNNIWSVKAKPKKGWKKFIFNRVTSFSLIISMGFILLVSLIVSAVLDSMNDRLQRYFPDMTIYLFYTINVILMLAVVALLFAVIFKVLPDAHISWKDALTGAVFTSLLFLLGKFAISFYLGQADLGVTYGAAASIVILLTWVYYTSLILFFGAEFTKMHAINHGDGITPSETAVFIVKRESKEIPT